MTKLFLLYNIAFFIPLLPALVALFRWKRLGKIEKTFVGMIWVIIVISFLGRLWAAFVVPNNLPFFHAYVLLEGLLLILVFSQLYESHWKNVKWIALGCLYLIAWIFNAAIFNGIWVYPDYLLAFEALMILFLVFGWFRKVLREKKIRNPIRTFGFWITSGLLVYYSGNFLLFLFSNFILEQDNPVYHAVWTVHTVLVILLYLMYTTGLLCIPKTKK